MNSLIITNTHILFGGWSSNRGKYVLADLNYVALSKPIKEALKSQDTVRTVLKEALDKFPLKGNQVSIAIDDELLYHDRFASDESFTKREIWDYIQWETKQKWGELGNFYSTFTEIDSPNPNALHSITCPTFLISEIKAVINNHGGKPKWAGPISSIYLENNQYRNAIYMIDDNSFIKFFYRGRDGYSEGKLRFIGGQPSVTVGIGDKEEQNSLFKSPTDARDFVSVDLISDTKNTYLRQYRHKRMFPFEGIEVEIDDIPENISFISLNALSIIIRDFSFDNLVDFFNPAQIQNRKYEGIGKLSFDVEGRRTNTKEQISDTKSEAANNLQVKDVQTKRFSADKKKVAREQIAKEKAEKAKAKNGAIDKKKAEKEQAKVDRADKKKAAREQIAKEKAAKAKAKKDAIDKRKAEKEQAIVDRVNKKKATKEQIAKEKAAKVKAKKDAIDKKRAEKEQAIVDRVIKKKAAKEQIVKEKAEKGQTKIDIVDKKKTGIDKTKPDVSKKEKPTKKKEIKVKDKRKEVKILPFLLIILVGIVSYYLFLTEGGKRWLDDIISSENIVATTDGELFFDQQYNQSASLIKTYLTITSVVSPDSIISANLVDRSGSVEFVGLDSLDIPDFEFINYSVDPIDCCGGVKQKVDFNITKLHLFRSDIWLNLSSVVNHLQSSIGITKIRQLDVISDNGTSYIPIIFEVDSPSQIDGTIQYLKSAGDNVIVRKIAITNLPSADNYSGKFYISVFEPL